MGYTSAQAKEFIARIAPIIRAEATARGYVICSTVIAQAIVEGAAGTSSLARKYHNHFGMKCGKSWKGKSVNLSTKEEYTPGTLTTIKDNFRVYDSDEEGVKGYYDFISSSRYANLKTAQNYSQYAGRIKMDGWATSNSYYNTLISTVKKYNLEMWDTVYSVSPVSSEYYGKFTGITNSIVMALGAVGETDTSKEHRSKIAKANGIPNYSGTAEQNTKLLSLLKQGKLLKS